MQNEIPAAFGAAVKKHRLLKGWSQMKLAMEAGLHLNGLGNLERGSRNPSLQTILLISKALEIPAAKLVGDVEKLLSKEK